MIYDIYTDGFYKEHEAWITDYELVGEWITKNCDFNTSFEFGCGNGFLTEYLFNSDKQVGCSDFSVASINNIDNDIKPFFKRIDVTELITEPTVTELVMCFELAEHINPAGTDIFFENLTNASSKYIVFSSEPTTNGTGHINCHPKEFWIEEICKRGFTLNIKKTEQFVNEVGPKIQHIKWYTNNFLYFERN
jgi:hypothetical protein